MNYALIGLATNIPQGGVLLQKVVTEIESMTPVSCFSDCYETEPVGEDSMGTSVYINCIGVIGTEKHFDTLRLLFKERERAAGRTSLSKVNGIIPLDIDIITWNNEIKKPQDLIRNYVQMGIVHLLSTGCDESAYLKYFLNTNTE